MGRLEELEAQALEEFSAFSPATKVQKRSAAGLKHALKPSSMDKKYAPRHLIEFIPGPLPMASVALGDISDFSHLTWQLNGIRYRTDTTAWGASEEAGRLQIAQRDAGARSPVVISWMGYKPPSLLGGLVDQRAREAAPALVDHWMRILPFIDARTNIEAHSYGGVTALYALDLLPKPYRFDTTLLSGAVGIPRGIDIDSLPARKLESIRAPWDIQSKLGTILSRLTSGRQPLSLTDLHEIEGTALQGHNTHGGQGYRDLGTKGLSWMARHTV